MYCLILKTINMQTAIILIVGILIGIFIPKGKSKGNKKVTIFTKKQVLDNHISPIYYGYGGGFSNTTKCNSCGSTGLYEDQHPVNPCRKCGGRCKEIGAHKWSEIDNVYQWIPSGT